MSNLASLILEGASVGYGGSLKHTYDHETGATLIAMESAEALRDIFEMTFYIPNSITIQEAAGNYVDYAVMEGVMGDVWEKIKKFFIELKEKIKELLHNIWRYLTGIFGDTVKWVTKYEKELKALKSKLDGYEVEMYDYINLEDYVDKCVPDFEKEIRDASDKINTLTSNSSLVDEDKSDDDDEIERFVETRMKELIGHAVDPEDFDTELFAYFRNGANDKNDMESVKVASKMDAFIKALKEQTKVEGKFKSAISKTDTGYKKLIKYVDGVKSKIENLDTSNGYKDYKHEIKMADGSVVNSTGSFNSTRQSNATKVLGRLSTMVSREQSLFNKMINAGKTALVERNAVYKKALTGCFAYARKNKDK